MKKISKWLVVLFAIVSIFGINIANANATDEENFEENGFKYTVLTQDGATGTVAINGYVFEPTGPIDLVIDGTVVHNDITYTVVTIGDLAFGTTYTPLSYHLTSVTIPDSVTTIGDWAFTYNKLTNVTIPDSVTTIGEYSFMFNQLTNVTIGNHVTTIGEGSFQSNLLTNVILPDSVITIEALVFNDNLLTSITIPDNVISIGDWAFASNNLASVTLGNSVTSIGSIAFAWNNLHTIYLANKDMLPVLSEDSLSYSSTGRSGDLPFEIIEIYAPELEAAYEDATDITKNVGEAFQLQVNSNVVYQQIERYEDAGKDFVDGVWASIGKFIGADENASTKPYDLTLPIAYQWYKDGEAIDGATNAIYDEVSPIAGEYIYYVTVNGVALDDIHVVINDVPVQPEPEEKPVGQPEDTSDIQNTPPTIIPSTSVKTNTETVVNTVDATPTALLLGSIVLSVGILAYVFFTVKKKSI